MAQQQDSVREASAARSGVPGIAGKVVVITGASSGLGEASARLLAAQGASVVLGARRSDRLDALAEALRADGADVEVLRTDVTVASEVAALVEHARARFGRVDVMVNNAGVMAIAPLRKAMVDDWNTMIDVNLRGVLHGIAAALPVFQAQGSGHFVNISSVAGLKVFGGGAVYSATKFAVRAVSEGLRQEVGESIRTTIVSPGAIATELPAGTRHPSSAKAIAELYEIAIGPDAIARAIAYAIGQPPEVDVNEIVLRPTAQSS
ncbi:SDR family oxidoreductase [Chitinasiproducens palmae]|uniref:Ketoreductase domain-containing protein n=1 Tax=Chitinasiproducens palmae TaxID=1770053 RepID=A0A1H2PRT6_9BURK|nr:SDR family oxidoreductase [Chitinasiproducens palmae]SDV49640.1 hypothetical protein SAMN05216551_10913 [Chitinasiproducens palmae]